MFTANIFIFPGILMHPLPFVAGPLSLSGKHLHGSEAVPDTSTHEDGARTPGSAEFFLGISDDNTALAHTAFTQGQQLQLNAQVWVAGDLSRHGKPPAEHIMVHAFGEPVEGQKLVWHEVWRAAVDRWESQKSLVPGYDTPPSSSLIGSCTSESKDTTACKIITSEPHSSEFHHNLLQHDGSEKESQVLDVGSASSRSPPDKHIEVLKQHAGGDETSQVMEAGSARGPPEEAVIISEPKQPAGDEEASPVWDVGSVSSHPLVNITEHYCNLPLHDSGSALSKKKPDPCVKCGKGGQLLKCRTCSLAAHGRCFGSSVRFDDSGLFDCPFCVFNKADEAYEKAKNTRSEARKNLSAFFISDQSVKQHTENQSGKQGNRQSEVPHSCHSRLSPIADRNIEAGKESGLMNSPMTGSRRVRFHIKETVVLHSYGKASGRRDQFMHSPARKRCYPQPPECHFATPPAGSPLGSTRRHGMSTARRKGTRWTRAEEAALREGVAKYLAEHPGAAAGNKNISWVQILKDGAGSFNPVHGACDLRKKWCLMKGRSRRFKKLSDLVDVLPCL